MFAGIRADKKLSGFVHGFLDRVKRSLTDLRDSVS